MTKIPKDIRCSFKIKELYVAGICDDCTRLTYAEILKDKKASTLTYFMARSLSWFKQIYNLEFEAVMGDKTATSLIMAQNSKEPLIESIPLKLYAVN